LKTFGPGTQTDLKWWTGWTVRDTKAALAAVGAVEVDLGGGDTGYVVPDDVEPTPEAGDWVALLPSLDPTVMGWKEREWYLGEYQSQLYDRNGNAGPTVWCSGRIVGGWAHHPSGEVRYELLEDIGADAAAVVAQRAADLSEWLGEARVKARFPTPLEKRLMGGGARR
jgi:hypothetical protein